MSSYTVSARKSTNAFIHSLITNEIKTLIIVVNSAKAIWDFEGIFCSSRHIPHVRFPGLIHPGILGCAPSAEILAEWNKREGELIATHSHLGRDVAKPPEPKYAHAGAATPEIKEKVAQEGARTIPVCSLTPPQPDTFFLSLNILTESKLGPTGERWQLRHQEPISWFQGLPPCSRPRRQILRRRPSLLPR